MDGIVKDLHKQLMEHRKGDNKTFDETIFPVDLCELCGSYTSLDFLKYAIQKYLAVDDDTINSYWYILNNVSIDWYFSPVLNSETVPADLSEALGVYLTWTKTVYAAVKFPELGDKEIFDEHDFDGVAAKGKTALRFIILFFDRLLQVRQLENINLKFLQSLTMKSTLTALSLYAQFVSPSKWSDDICHDHSKQLLDILLQLHHCKSLSELLNTTDSSGTSLLISIVSEHQKKLTKATWKKNPGVMRIIQIFISALHFPHMSDHLDYVLPAALMLVDDFECHNQRDGLMCLYHIMENCTRTELRWFNRADVIYEAVQKLTYTKDKEVLSSLYPALLLVLKTTEDVTQDNAVLRANRFDFHLERMLADMDLEDSLAIRRIHSAYLKQFIETLELGVLRHMNKLLRVCFSYLEITDGKEETARKNILLSLITLTSYTWPRIPQYSEDILKSILKLWFELDSEKSFLCTNQSKQDLVDLSRELLVLMCRADNNLLPVLQTLGKQDICQKYILLVLEDINKE